jgi:hypothetical protein
MPFLLRAISYLLPRRAAHWLLRRFTRLGKSFYASEPDLFMEVLLKAMALAFCLCRDFRGSIRGFEAAYAFQTADGGVRTAAVFSGGAMTVLDEVPERHTVAVTFLSVRALRAFLFSGNQDILDSILANAVQVDGNLNYIYKFGFLARDLAYRLEIQP